MERALIPFGLHHVFYIPFWQTGVGGTATVCGNLVEGAQNIFFAELACADTVKFSTEATRFMSGKFTMDDLLKQIEATQKMGPLASIMKMLPGMGEAAKALEGTDADNQLKKVKAIIQSMTLEEREDPSIIRNSHKRRIALGSGTNVNDINKLINQYDRMKKLMKQMSSIKGGGFGGLFR